MHKIDCQKFLKMDTPDALVLAILCDFKDRDKSEVITYIIQRLNELTKDNQHQQDKYMVILETLSTNRDLKDSVKEIEEMLRTIDVTKMPSYGRYMESKRLLEEGIEIGLSQGSIKTAITMIEKFKLSIKDVARELDIPINELKKNLKNQK
jgi:predicted transposase YdaD